MGMDVQAVALYAPDAPSMEQEQEKAGSAADAQLLDLINAGGRCECYRVCGGDYAMGSIVDACL